MTTEPRPSPRPARRMVRPEILSLGSIDVDFLVRVDPGDPADPSVRGHDFRRAPGGKGANVALLARRLGMPAVLLGRVGDDDLADVALAPLREAGVDLASVRHDRGPTGVTMIRIGPGGAKRSVYAGGANLGLDDDDGAAFERRIEAARAGSLLVADWEVEPAVVAHAIGVARRRGLRVLADPSVPAWVDRRDLRHVQVLTLNEREARQLTGIEGTGPRAAEAAARALAALGPSLVCVKLDDSGCLALHEGRAWVQQSARVPVVDTTGVGDAFAAALGVALLEDQPVADAVEFAVAVAEIAVGAYGAQTGYPTREAAEEGLRAVKRARMPPAG